jgi:hypothetical protein
LVDHAWQSVFALETVGKVPFTSAKNDAIVLEAKKKNPAWRKGLEAFAKHELTYASIESALTCVSMLVDFSRDVRKRLVQDFEYLDAFATIIHDVALLFSLGIPIGHPRMDIGYPPTKVPMFINKLLKTLSGVVDEAPGRWRFHVSKPNREARFLPVIFAELVGGVIPFTPADGSVIGRVIYLAVDLGTKAERTHDRKLLQIADRMTTELLSVVAQSAPHFQNFLGAKDKEVQADIKEAR